MMDYQETHATLTVTLNAELDHQFYFLLCTYAQQFVTEATSLGLLVFSGLNVRRLDGLA